MTNPGFIFNFIHFRKQSLVILCQGCQNDSKGETIISISSVSVSQAHSFFWAVLDTVSPFLHFPCLTLTFSVISVPLSAVYNTAMDGSHHRYWLAIAWIEHPNILKHRILAVILNPASHHQLTFPVSFCPSSLEESWLPNCEGCCSC